MTFAFWWHEIKNPNSSNAQAELESSLEVVFILGSFTVIFVNEQDVRPRYCTWRAIAGVVVAMFVAEVVGM